MKKKNQISSVNKADAVQSHLTWEECEKVFNIGGVEYKKKCLSAVLDGIPLSLGDVLVLNGRDIVTVSGIAFGKGEQKGEVYVSSPGEKDGFLVHGNFILTWLK